MKSLAIFLLTLVYLPLSALDLKSEAEAVYVLNPKTGAVLYAKNGDKQLYPASTIKVVTALYALSKAGHELQRRVPASSEALYVVSDKKKEDSGYTLPPHWLETGAKTIALREGETLSLEQLLHAHLIVSACDASNVLIEQVCPDMSRFPDEVNAFIRQMGFHDIKVMNPHGLHHPDQVVTARELALVTREALKVPAFRRAVQQSHWIRPSTAHHDKVAYRSTNRLITRGKLFHPHVTGVKTGYTSHAKHCFVSAAKLGERELIVVVLGHPKRAKMFAQVRSFFERASQEAPVERVLLGAGPQTFTRDVDGAEAALTTQLNEPVALSVYPSEEAPYKMSVEWQSIQVPVKQGELVGLLKVKGWEDRVIATRPLYAAAPLSGTAWYRLTARVDRLWQETVFFELLVACILCLLVFRVSIRIR